MASRTKVLLAIIAVAVAAGFVGWYAGQQIKSPEQIAADTAAPEASLITVPVESRTLSRDVITRTNAAFQDSTDLSLNLSTSGGSAPIVTGRVPALGDELAEGTVGLEIAGRPVFILEGELPSFRSMGPGTSGVDVLQLEQALLRLGFFVGVADELFDSETEAALNNMYLQAGYSAPELTEGEKIELQNAADAIERAEDAIEDAEDRLSDSIANSERSASSIAQEGQSLVNARRQVADAEYGLIQINMSNPQGDIDSAENDAVVALAEMNAAQQAVLAAELSQPPIPEGQLAQLEGDLDQARAAYSQLQAQFEQLRDSRASAIRNANASIVSAREGLALAELQNAESMEPPDYSGEQEAIEDANDDLTEAQEALVELEDEIGTVFPQSEFLFLGNLPRLVSRVDVEPGQTVTDSVMRISGDTVTFSGGIPEISRRYVTVGSTVVIDDAGTGIEITGTITELADNAGTNGQPDSRYYFEIEPTTTFVAEDVVSVGNFRLVIPIERTEGEVLAVPVAALSAGADGSSRVEVARGESTALVEVVVGLEADGFAEIEPIGAELVAGEDRVVIGIDRTGGSGGG